MAGRREWQFTFSRVDSLSTAYVYKDIDKLCSLFEKRTTAHYLRICEIDLVRLEQRLDAIYRIAFARASEDYLVLLAFIVLEDEP